MRSRHLSKGFFIAAMVAFTLLVSQEDSAAASCSDISFDDTYSSSGGDLTLNGMGIRKATFLKVEVYVVALYLTEKASDPGKILSSDKAWRLDLHFVRDVDAKDMQDAFHEGFENTGEDLTPLESRIDQLVGTLSDFSEGDSLTFTYLPGSGTSTGLNGMEKDVVKGGDFAKALLAIWLGKKPANEDMKTGLLGEPCQ